MPLYEAQTPETIKNRILARMETSLQTREGSYSNDMAGAVSYELWRMLLTFDSLISALYVDADSGPYLDEHAALLGLARREGARAGAEIIFSGRDGTVVPAETAFFTAEGREFLLTEAVTLANGNGTGTLRAAEVGGAWNVEAGEIAQIGVSIAGLSGFEAGAATGGADRESDKSLYARIVNRRQSPSTSGNENHYKEWALRCEGVGAAWVTRLWDGPGTVRVLISGYDLQPLDATIVEACAAYIETQRPVGALVTVESVRGEKINVGATLILEDGVSAAGAAAAFTEALTAWFLEAGEKLSVVYFHRVAALLMDVEGVVDYAELRVNGGTENITIPGNAVPVVGEVSFSA